MGFFWLSLSHKTNGWNCNGYQLMPDSGIDGSSIKSLKIFIQWRFKIQWCWCELYIHIKFTVPGVSFLITNAKLSDSSASEVHTMSITSSTLKSIKELVKKAESDFIYWGMLQYCLRYVVFHRITVPSVWGWILIQFTQRLQTHWPIPILSLDVMPEDDCCSLELLAPEFQAQNIHQQSLVTCTTNLSFPFRPWFWKESSGMLRIHSMKKFTLPFSLFLWLLFTFT